MQWRGVRRLSVCPSVNFCASRFFSKANLHTMDSRSACIQGVLKVKVKVKGHVIRALSNSWIFGMSYSVIDGLVELQNCALSDAEYDIKFV